MMDNGITRPALLLFSGGGSWEKARHCTRADSTIPLSLIGANQCRAAQSQLFYDL